jgi:hypothetical protein
MSTGRRRWLPLLAILAVAGCGGGGDPSGSSTSAEPQPVNDFVKEADAICAREEQRQKTDAPPAPKLDAAKPTAADLKKASAYFQAQLQFAHDEVDALAAVAPPEGNVEQWQSIVARYQDEMLPAFEDVAAATEAGDADAFKAALQTLIRTGGELSSAAGDIGLTSCGS